MQDAITDLEEDTRQKLTQTWDAITASIAETNTKLAEAQTELAAADASLMSLVKSLGDKPELKHLLPQQFHKM